MLKLCGALCVLAASALIGIAFRRRLARRVLALQGLLQAFSLLRTEIVFLQTPLAQATEKIALQCDAPVFAGFASALQENRQPDEAMRIAAAAADGLAAADAAILNRAAVSLGRSDAAAQGQHIDTVILQLKAQLQEAKALLEARGKLCTVAGVLGGMLLVILLL